MKASDLFMVQHCAAYGSFRVLPLRTCEAGNCLSVEDGAAHPWVVVAHAGTEAGARSQMQAMKKAARSRRKEDR